jgi:hypothetical protein
MKIKYSPMPDITKPATIIKVLNDYSIEVDGNTFTFDPLDGEWEDIAKQTNGVILEAHLENDEPYVTARRYYDGITHPDWDDGEYHTMEIEA